jgi:hypothetical protein
MRRWNDVLRMRSLRYFSAESHVLSKVIWLVLILGGVLNVMATWLFVIKPRRAHVTLTAMLAGMIGLLLFLLLAMDQPFRGHLLPVEKDPFVLADRQAHAEPAADHAVDAPGEACKVPKPNESGTP